ncbi:hypothetical protein D3C80_1060000 [compost metagenome]
MFLLIDPLGTTPVWYLLVNPTLKDVASVLFPKDTEFVFVLPSMNKLFGLFAPATHGVATP